jgi:hypothetical protein
MEAEEARCAAWQGPGSQEASIASSSSFTSSMTAWIEWIHNMDGKDEWWFGRRQHNSCIKLTREREGGWLRRPSTGQRGQHDSQGTPQQSGVGQAGR